MTSKRNKYSHIESFEDFENEKVKLFFQIKLAEKKLELKFLDLSALLNPMRLIPMLLNEWLTPFYGYARDWISSFFKRKGTNHQNSTDNFEEKEQNRD